MALWSKRHASASQESIAALEMAAGIGVPGAAPVAVAVRPPDAVTRPTADVAPVIAPPTHAAPAFGTPPPARNAPTPATASAPSAPTLPTGALARRCRMPEVHASWWRLLPAAEGALAVVVCGLCEYAGAISERLRAVLADPPDPTPAGERAEMAARLLAWGAAHDWPRLPLATGTGASNGVAQPFLWLCAGEGGWRGFAGANSAALLRSAWAAAEGYQGRDAA